MIVVPITEEFLKTIGFARTAIGDHAIKLDRGENNLLIINLFDMEVYLSGNHQIVELGKFEDNEEFLRLCKILKAQLDMT